MMSVHADWAVADAAGFQRALDARRRDRRSSTTRSSPSGVVPTRADPGFGYIQPGDELGDGARRVARFVEKPDRARAEEMRRDGYLWNSGIFVWRVGDFLDDVRRLTPEVAPARCTRMPTTSHGILRGGDADLGRRRRAGAERPRRRPARRFRLGRRRHLGRAQARARQRRRGERGRRATCTPSTRATTSCTRRTRRSCCTACRTSSSSCEDGLVLVTTVDKVERSENAHGRAAARRAGARMTTLYLYDDARARTFEPFASTRPSPRWSPGTALIRERWRVALQPDERALHRRRAARRLRRARSARRRRASIPAGSIVANCALRARAAADAAKVARRAATCSMWRCGDRARRRAASRSRSTSRAFADGSLTLDELYAGTGAIGDVDGWWLDEVWDFIRLLPEQLAERSSTRLASQPCSAAAAADARRRCSATRSPCSVGARRGDRAARRVRRHGRPDLRSARAATSARSRGSPARATSGATSRSWAATSAAARSATCARFAER